MPQGSISGPSLFLLYINDIANVSDVIFSLFFADDSIMFLSGKNLDKTDEYRDYKRYRMVENNQAVTKSKKHILWCLEKSRRRLELKEDVIIDNVKIYSVTQTKFLGVILDQHLTFDSHVQYTEGKMARGIGILYKTKKYLKESSMKTLHYAFIYPYFTYCIAVWGNTFNSVLEPLIVLKNVQ